MWTGRSFIETGIAPGLLALSLLLTSAQGLHAEWTRMGGPTLPEVSEFVTHAGRLIIGTDYNDHGEVFVSQDNGYTWSNAGLPNGGVSCMLSHDNELFVGGYLTGIYRSSDSGENWEQIGAELGFNSSVEALIALADGSLLAGLDDGFAQPLFRSTDGGDTWTALEGAPSLRCYTLLETGGVILAGGETTGVWRSVNGGDTWVSSSSGLPESASVHALAEQDGVLYAAAGSVMNRQKVYCSEDAGLSWTLLSTNLPEFWNVKVHDLLAVGDDLYLAASAISGDEGLYHSSDGGFSWARINEEIAGEAGVSAMIQLEDTLLIGTEYGVFRSAIAAVDWQASSTGASGVCGGTATFWTGDRLLVANDQSSLTHSGLQHTTDFGDTWTAAEGELAATTAVDFLQLEAAVYAAFYGFSRGVGVSQDGGLSFSATGTGMDNSVVLKCLAMSDDGLLAGSWTGLWRLNADTASWSLISNPGVVYDLVTHEGWIYAGLYPGGVIRSQDGVNWESTGSGLAETERVNDLLQIGDTLLAALNSNRVVRLVEGVWEDIEFPAATPVALAEVGGTLLVGCGLGEIWVKPVTGEWQLFDDGFYSLSCTDLQIAGDRLVLATRGGGFWTRPLSEVPISTDLTAALVSESGWNLQAWPNPFNPSTSIPFTLMDSQQLSLRIYDLQGRLVQTLAEGVFSAGSHRVQWQPQGIASGVYVIQLSGVSHRESIRATLLK